MIKHPKKKGLTFIFIDILPCIGKIGEKKKKSRIRETKHLSTDADSSTDTTVGWTKNTQKPKFFEKGKKSSNTLKLKNVYRYANISDIHFDQRSLIHREAWFPPFFVRKNQQKNFIFLRGDFRQLPNQKVQILDHFFPFFSPKDSKSLKYWTSNFGKWVKRYLKSEQTHSTSVSSVGG